MATHEQASSAHPLPPLPPAAPRPAAPAPASPVVRRSASWEAIFAGVSITVALYLILLILGVGLGFSLLSLWSFQVYMHETIGIATVFWLILTQLISSGGGGYVAGRLASTEWSGINDQQAQGTDFYYTAHGLVVWAVASILIAFLFETAANEIISSKQSVIASVARGVGVGTEVGTAYLGGSTFLLPDSSSRGDPNETYRGEHDSIVIKYALDFLFRPSSESMDSDSPGVLSKSAITDEGKNTEDNMRKMEIARTFVKAFHNNKMSHMDKQYISQLVAEHTGISNVKAARRVDETLEQITSVLGTVESQNQRDLDSTRQAAAVSALWTVAALISGALVASGAACRGGSWSRRFASRAKSLSGRVR